MRNLTKETRDFLLNLIRRELDAEEDYQSGNCDYEGNRDEESLDYVKDLIKAQKELLLQNSKGIMSVICMVEVEENLDRFGIVSDKSI